MLELMRAHNMSQGLKQNLLTMKFVSFFDNNSVPQRNIFVLRRVAFVFV